MKRIFTLAGLLFLRSQLLAQNIVAPTHSIGQSVFKPRTENAQFTSTNYANKEVPQIPFFPAIIGNRENVGGSTYDLQTNGSMQRRVLQYGNKISCFWTFSTEESVNSGSAFADRGTGYVHFDGTNWSTAPTLRLENTRTGFSSAFINGSGEESYVAHGGANNTLFLGKKTGATWSLNVNSTSVANAPIWPHAASSGNWLYIIASPLDSNVHANGLRNGYFFARSNDNGVTWLDDMIPLPLIDSVGHYRGGGNSYSISARGSHVSILCGDMGTDLTLLSSSDYGANWTKKVVFDWPLDNYDFAGSVSTDTNNDGTADTLFCNDGAQTLALDTAGVAHVAFPIIKVYKSGANNGFGFFYTSSLAYYNSLADSVSVVDNIFALYHDCDGDGQFGIGENYSSATTGTPDANYYTIGTITQPSITIVNSNPQKILISYTAIMDNDTTVDDGIHQYWYGSSSLTGQNYRDVFVVGTDDSGSTWTYPVNVTKSAHFEEAFASTPELIIGDNLPILYEGDIEPGTVVANSDTYEGEFKNTIILHNVSVSEIFTKGADSTAPCGQTELPLGVKNILNKKQNTANIFPNPSNDYFQIKLNNLQANGKYTMTIYDILGKKVSQNTIEMKQGNSERITISEVTSGVYFVTLNNEQGSISLKLKIK